MTPEQIDLYKLRSEDYARNFHSLREVEWHTTYQVYAGYAAVALAYWQLRGTYDSSRLLVGGGVVLVLVLFWSSLYLSLRIQERLHFTRDMQNLYLQRLHDELGAAKLDPPPTTKEPMHGRSYAFVVQTILSGVIGLAIIVYMLGS